MVYAQLLRDPRWKQLRVRILERDGYTCQNCNNTEEVLHVHHRFYAKGCLPWEYQPGALTTLCATCHDRMTDLLKTARALLGFATEQELVYVIGLIAGDRRMLGDGFAFRDWIDEKLNHGKLPTGLV